MNKEKITIFITHLLNEKLKTLSQKNEISQGFIIREALRDYFKKHK